MIVFEEIFKQVLKIESNKRNKRNKSCNGFPLSNILLFSTYFIPSVFKTSNNYSWKKYIAFKFFILDNFLHYKCNHTIDSDIKDMLSVFSATQKHMMALYRFKNICLFKTKKYSVDQQDLQFNLLSEMSPKYTIDIIQSGVKHQFSIFDLIRIINTSLSYEFNFFTDPKEIKNPWNNIPFTSTNLYNIYFFLDYTTRNTSIKMPILFSRYFQSNFCLEHFEDHNQLIIKKYIIENCHLFNNVKKLSHIYNMIDIFNRKRIKYRINIDVGFPESILLEVMEPYLKLYLLANYSYEEDLLIKYQNILTNKLRLFHKNNPMFGRKIIATQLKKLYYISCLYYNDNMPLFFPNNIYLPRPSLISLVNKCYYIDKINETNYSNTPDFENTNKIIIPMNICGILAIVRRHAFTNEEKAIIKNKYEIHVNKPNIIDDNSMDIDSGNDSDSGNDIGNDIGNNIGNNDNIDDNIDDDDNIAEFEFTFETYAVDDISNGQFDSLIELLQLDQPIDSNINDDTVDNFHHEMEEFEDDNYSV